MRSIWRTLDRTLLRDAGALAAAVLMVGISFGALAVAAGIGAWQAVGMSLLVFAGGAQFLAVGVVAAGGAAAAAVAGGLLLNARHLPFGLAVAEAIGRRWPARLVGAHILVDETVAFATAQPDPQRARRAYWTAGLSLFVAFNAGTVVGVLAGQAVGDPARYGVDAAFPAALLALLLPSLRGANGGADARRVALAGALLALLATPLLPPGLPVMLALAALALAGRPPRAGRADRAGRDRP
ncbi:MAG TPA: AzlC family ABC transporter permease [Pseudonocardiaceae bacterium]|jgi:4-azaleucine resistance transporter AzlC